MQPQLSESTAVNWGQDTLNAIQMAGADIARNAIIDAGGGNIGEALSGMVNDTTGAINRVLGDGGSKEQVIAYFAGQAVGANNLVARTAGQVINPNL